MFPITGTGSRVKALYSEQHRSTTGSIEDNPFFFTGKVPEGLLRDCETSRKDTLVSSTQKTTNLYRRVSTVTYRNDKLVKVDENNKRFKTSNAKCLACLATLVKSSKDWKRAGVKLRCRCNVRVCTTCFKNNSEWYLAKPHFMNCSTIQGFICTVCACFKGFKEKLCCVWMCSGCSSKCREQHLSCSKCSRSLDRCPRRETHTLWSRFHHDDDGDDDDDDVDVDVDVVDDDDQPKEAAQDSAGDLVTCAEEKVADYRDLIRSRVFDRVSQSRHLSSSDIRTLFHECFAAQPCTCKTNGEQNPMCTSCTPVLTITQLLAKNPRPLIASLAERAVPGRVLSRNVYDRALLVRMLNERDLPSCANGRSCKGMLLNPQNNPRPLPSLISPESYERFVSNRAETGEVQQISPCRCILCLLFNQSAAVAQMFSPDSLHLDPHPSGPVYYFNVKLSPDVGVPEVCVDGYQGLLVNFQGSVGSWKPTLYYNWRDMLKVLQRDESGKVLLTSCVMINSPLRSTVPQHEPLVDQPTLSVSVAAVKCPTEAHSPSRY